jgi:tRNA(His) 5'-end guanylyltransferase
MDPDDFEARMRALEYFHDLRVLPGAWPVLRLDGRSFSRLTETQFDKPFDLRFHELMCRTTEALVGELGAVYGYTESDEISLLFPSTADLFDRSVEKLVSISASIAGGTFSLGLGAPAQFDCRIWMGAQRAQVADYFRWRQNDAARCALNGWAYWTLRKAGRGVGEATAALEGQSVGFKNELLFQHGINFNDVPAWQKRGTGVYWETFEKQGFNPKLGQAVTAVRRRLKVDRELPMADEYNRFVLGFLGD